MIKHILVKPETHKEVDKVRADEGLKTFDEAIKSLLARPDFTQDQLVFIGNIMNLVAKGDDLSVFANAEICINIVDKAYETWKDVAECLDDRCKSERPAGEELRKKLVEPAIVHNKVEDGPTGGSGDVYGVIRNPRCLTGEEEKKVDEMLKEYFQRQEEAEKECREEMNKRVVKALVDGVDDRK